jgi:hypothetical protein
MTITPDAPAEVEPREYTTGELLKEWDRRRARSLQKELGMSGLGGCQRQARYILDGVEPTDDGTGLQAVMGTLIHAGGESVFKELQAEGLIPAEDLVEFEVRFAGVLGHLDRFDSVRGKVIDTKTTWSGPLRKIKQDGKPPRSHLWQVNMYAAALILLGYLVRSLAIDYICRDTGEEYRWEGVPDPAEVKAALEWLAETRTADLDWLPREYAPDGPYCGGCQFFQLCWDTEHTARDRDPRAVLFREDPDAAKWAAELWQARQDKKDAVDREEKAKGALDALRPNTSGKESLDVGFERPLVWTVKYSDRFDAEQIRSDYAAAGAEVPTKTSTTVELRFGPKPKPEKKPRTRKAKEEAA